MKRSLAFGYVLGLFLLGVVIGAMGMHLYYAERFPPARPGAPPPPPGLFFAERLERQLDLTPEQSREIEAILEEARIEAERLRRETAPKLRDGLERTRQRIAEVLTPEQREKFDRLTRRHRRRAERFFLGERPRRVPRDRPADDGPR